MNYLIFRKKRQLKGSGLGVSESLTKKRMELYRSVKGHPKIETAWSQDGRVSAFFNYIPGGAIAPPGKEFAPPQ
jgi:hypothetical protein